LFDVKVTSRVRRLYWSLLFGLSKRRTIADIEIGVLLPETAHKALIEQKIDDAFNFLTAYGRKYLTRAQELADGILLFGTVGPLGSWNKDARLIRISQDFITDEHTKPVHIAATIVHEATHAWLDHRGFAYAPESRARIEAICYRAQSTFAAKVPGCEEVALEYEECAQLVLEQPDDEWSDEAFHLRAAEHFIELGIPQWLAKWLSRSSSVRPNER
jgi:hypothetical protein